VIRARTLIYTAQAGSPRKRRRGTGLRLRYHRATRSRNGFNTTMSLPRAQSVRDPAINPARVLGLAGWSGAGKTTLLTRLIPALTQRGLRVATVKHAHHAFDVDQPGKDSYEHRRAGASEVIVSSARRWVVMHELGDAAEASLADLLRRVSPCDLVLVEGFKRERLPKIEVFRGALGKPALQAEDAHIVAIASDEPLAAARVPVIDLNNVAAVADVVCERAEPLARVLAALEA
jgi:molybdopterin-guanine dinucleotide biosynthesis protein B